MADNAFFLFNLPDTPFLSHMSSTYPQSQNSSRILTLLPQLLPCVIFTLCRKLCKWELLKMLDIRGCTDSETTSDPPYWSILLSNMHPSLKAIFYRCTDTYSSTIPTLSNSCTNLGKNQFLWHGGWLWRPTSWMASPNQESLQTTNHTLDWEGVSPVSLKHTASRTNLSSKINPSPLA